MCDLYTKRMKRDKQIKSGRSVALFSASSQHATPPVDVVAVDTEYKNKETNSANAIATAIQLFSFFQFNCTIWPPFYAPPKPISYPMHNLRMLAIRASCFLRTSNLLHKNKSIRTRFKKLVRSNIGELNRYRLNVNNYWSMRLIDQCDWSIQSELIRLVIGFGKTREKPESGHPNLSSIDI